MKIFRLRSSEVITLARELAECECTVHDFTSEGRVQNVIDVVFSNKAIKEIARVASRAYSKAPPGQLSSEANTQLGLTGQCAAAFYLYDDYKKGLETVRFGESDWFDIMYHEVKIEVKAFRWTRPYRPDSWINVPLYQWNSPRRHYPYYIATQEMLDNTFRILGIIDREHFEAVGNTEPSSLYRIPGIRIEHLRDLAEIKCFKCAFEPNVHCEKFNLCSTSFESFEPSWDECEERRRLEA